MAGRFEKARISLPSFCSRRLYLVQLPSFYVRLIARGPWVELTSMTLPNTVF